MRRLPFILGVRYSAGGSGNSLVSFLSRLSMAGLVLGVALLLTVMSVMNGFDREMRQRILALVPHITLQPTLVADSFDWQGDLQAIEQHPEVLAVAPFISGNALLIKGVHAEPVLFNGIDVKAEKQVSRLGEFVDLRVLDDAANPQKLLLGRALAAKLGVSIGDAISLAVPGGVAESSPLARRPIHFARFSLAGIVDTGTELDQELVLMGMASAEQLLPNQPRALRVQLADVFEAPRVAWELNAVHGRDYDVRDWTRQFGNMYHAIQMSRRLVVIMLLSVVAVAVFNIVSTLVLVVNDKRGDIAILRSQGASQADILAAFMVFGGLIGAMGTGLGALLGLLLSWSIGRIVSAVEQLVGIQILNSDVYPISYLPSDIRAEDVLLLSASALLMSLLAALYPAWRASRQPPAQALQH
ncbi:lipoprotein-releasing ABC transporter permease subunit [Spongiibacter sp. KMU-158]|uniref:Lipoprotein-releasing ABC transporter permease subunit n=1 Tax=Spongiibacter pelagi TaxID=2760804 RepID=A0A927GWF4_9GAMM|nr:lipoprotein-releasing ABC transporter permease subunit [Spongiibacter pelagi]MBD2859068.1 lipoprotein-releasing ABC transporter permease subunit [Spongiibacter pelagi]